MKKLLPRLTYSNVVATLALFLLIGGGAAYAAGKLGKNSVKSANIAKGAVKNSDLGNNAVTSSKIKGGSLLGSDIAGGVIPSAPSEITGTGTIAGGSAVNQTVAVTVPIGGTTTFTPQDGQVSALVGEVSMSIATTNAMNQCSPKVRVFASQGATQVGDLFLGVDTNSTTLNTVMGRDADAPFEILSPGTPLTLTAQVVGDVDCTPASKLNSAVVRTLEFK